MMKAEKVLVRNIGIVRNGYEYRADELYDYNGKKVNIRYDPDDITTLYVFDQSGKQICEAVSQELLTFGKVSDNEISHMKMQDRQLKRDQERLKNARKPFDEIHEEYASYKSTVGGIDLTIEGRVRKDKMVAFPQSKLYQKNPELREKKADEETESTYFDKNAEKALKKLRALEG